VDEWLPVKDWPTEAVKEWHACAPVPYCWSLVLQDGELRTVVRADDARVDPAGLGMANQIGDAPVGAEAVAPDLLDLGIQIGEPRPASTGEQQVGEGRVAAQSTGAAFPN
jgi:hypothetical protein